MQSAGPGAAAGSRNRHLILFRLSYVRDRGRQSDRNRFEITTSITHAFTIDIIHVHDHDDSDKWHDRSPEL